MEKKLDDLCRNMKALTEDSSALKEDSRQLKKDVAEIKRVLKGDDYGHRGLVDSHKTLKKECIEVKEDIKKAKVAGTVIAAILAFFGSIIALFRE